jgi:hypothetical protein
VDLSLAASYGKERRLPSPELVIFFLPRLGENSAALLTQNSMLASPEKKTLRDVCHVLGSIISRKRVLLKDLFARGKGDKGKEKI